MSERLRSARIAGLWYLAMAVSGPIGIVYAPSKILAEGDPAATQANIVAHELLLRVGIAASVFCQVSFVFLVLALERLFRGVSEKYAKLMVALVIVSVPIAVGNELFAVAALELGRGAAYLGAFSAEQRSTLALLFMNVHQEGINLCGFFWGLWLLPFGVLVIRSGFIPKVLGVLLLLACVAYVVESSFNLLAPQHQDLVASIVTLPMALGELSMVLWLLIRGVRRTPLASEQSRPALASD